MDIQGIVLSITPYKESGGIVNLLTSRGIMTFNAHGIMKIDSKLAPICQLYNVINVSLTESKVSKNLTLSSGVILKDFRPIYEDLESMVTLGFIVEITKKILDDENTQKIYILLLKTIDAILTKKDLKNIRLIYITQAIILSGLKLDVDECVRCGSTKAILSLSYEDGGFVCKKCFDQSQDVVCGTTYIKLARYLFISDYCEVFNKDLPDFEARKLFKDLYKFLVEQLGIQVKSYNLLEKIIK